MKNNTSRYSMILTKEMIAKLEKIKKEKGFKHRSDAILYLINIALDFLINK